nr:immunoglobulin light chain junction region [Macaca mulatta]
CQQHNTFPYTF